jgi:predicted GNAT family N-acyltransferase
MGTGPAEGRVQIKRIRSAKDLERAFAIRMRVFVNEQNVPAEIEMDGDDQRAIHFLALSSGKAVGTARLVVRRSSAKIGRMAVLKTYRRKRIGTKLLQCAITTAIKLRANKIYLHAQVPVIEFYKALGFRSVGPVFEEAGIPHRKMILKSTSSRRQATAKKSNRKQMHER